MIAVFAGSTDISQYIERDSVQIRENLNNQRNTCDFTTLQQQITQGSSVYLYAALQLRGPAASGQKILKVMDTYPDTDKFRPGDTIVIGVGTAHERDYVIDTIDHDDLEVAVTENLLNTIAADEVCGYLQFAGVCIKIPQEEIGHTGTFEYKTSLSDWGALFDREIVVNTFTEQYPREIYGRIVYDTCAMDTEVSLEGFESAWTESAEGRVMATETTDRIEGTNAQKTGVTGAGTGVWTKTISSTDISGQKHVRFWHKITDGNGASMTGLKLRIGTDASNYFEYTFANIGEDFEDCWNWDSAKLANYSAIVGSPDLAAVTWLQLRVTATASIPAGQILFDHMLASTGGFTLQGVIRGETKFEDLRINYVKPTLVVDDIAKRLGLFWYIDYGRDLHLITRDGTPSPFDITDSSQNYSNLVITPDMTKIVNRQTVKGGEAAGADLFTEEFVADGEQTTFRLSYKPKDLTIEVNDGGGFDPKTAGVENLVDPGAYDFVYSFQEKSVRNSVEPKLTAGDIIKFSYYPYKPIRKRVVDYASVARMKTLTGGNGYYDGAPIIDSTIVTFDDATLRARAETDAYGNPIITATFHTERDGIHPGMLQHITDSSRGIDDDYLVQQVMVKEKNNGRFTYDVVCGSSLFGIVQFLQWLIRKNITSQASDDLVDVVINIDETITLTDEYVFTQKDKTVYAASKLVKNFDFITEEGTVTANGRIGTGLVGSGWYGSFTAETGVIEFDDASNYNTEKALKITTTIGGTGKEAKATLFRRIPVTGGQTLTVSAWCEILAALTNLGTGAGLKIVLKEYAGQYATSVIATNTLISGATGPQDFTKVTAPFVLDGSTTHVALEISLVAAIGEVSVSDIRISASGSETSTLPGIASFSQAT